MSDRKSRLQNIGAISPENTPANQLQQSKPTTGASDEKIYKIAIEMDERTKERFFDFRYYLVQKYGVAGNREALQEAIEMVFEQIKDIKPRPEAVRNREKTTFRTTKRK